MSRRRTKSRGQLGRRGWIVGAVVAVVAIAAIVLSVTALQQTRTDPQAAASYEPKPWPTRTPPPPAPPQRQLAEIAPRLADSGREFTVLVFGDSTGVSAAGWQVLVPQWLGEQHDRPVVLHPWDRDATQYAGVWELRDGDSAPVTVWNASSPGRDVAFAREHQAAMAPIDPATVDIVFVNFGHTEKRGAIVPNVGSFMEDAAAQYPNAAVVYLKQNPDHSRSPLKATQVENVKAMATWAGNHNFASIPVFDAIQATGNVDPLMDEPTMIHPNADGYRVWADVMISSLTDAGF
ncbi:hypothetical protein QFZ62_000705 [Clavibacter sp. B3I6]|uniref:SGNH/GDSL hydrolase family protein n=1 Tax=Clavibacter sp. B3I6 TaxID=3042268 RepID=UPI0027891C41|nr:SGNH/GDSL hydrolase family protein [Clavibacter sp. B3I6]MDQ0743397.1 hypothetical protein [Clavibacter sp. B3I6]